MRVLHIDVERGWRGGQVQLAHLLERAPGPVEVCHDGPGLVRALRRFRPDVVAAHSPRSHQLALLQPRPLVVHRRVDFRPRGLWKYRRARAVIAVSHAVRDVLVQAGVERVEVVYDGIPAAPAGRRLERPEGPLVLAVGALVDHKAHSTLVEAARRGGFSVWIAGRGPLREALEAQARGVPVELLGQRDDVPDLLATADVFCHPSREEGLGQAVLEARAAGCRVVATRAGGVPEAAGPHAFLVPPDDPDALAVAVARALDTPRPAADLPERFTVDAMVAATWAVYARAVG